MTQIFLLAPSRELLKACDRVFSKLGLPWQEVGSVDELVERAEREALVFLPLKEVGLEGVSELRRQTPTVEIVALASSGTVGEATEAMRRGAIDYLERPWEEKRILDAVRHWQAHCQAISETAHLSQIITLMELGRTLTSMLRLEELYDQIIEQVERAFTPDTVSLMLLSGRGRRLRLVVVAQRGLPQNAAPGTEVTLEESIAGTVLREGRPQLLLGGLQGTAFERMARRGASIGSAMSVPLKVQHETLGVLNVSRHQGRANYTESDANLLHVFAAQIAIALQNARLYESLREERDRILQAQEDVRRELARDLHDGLAQVLATLAVNIDHLRSMIRDGRLTLENVQEELEFMRTVARQAIHDARTLIFGLRPLVLETQGLVPALQHYLNSLREMDRRATYHLEHKHFPDELPLAPKVARMVFAILQEALNNARKHARAQNIWVRLQCKEEKGRIKLIAMVLDDGVGFSLQQVEKTYDQRYSFGLLNMKERAALIDARLHMESGSQGTLVQVEVPWRANDAR